VSAPEVHYGAGGSKHYTYPPTGERYASVTTILGATEGKPWLMPWAAKLAAEYAADNLPDLLAMLDGEDGRRAVVDLVKSQAELMRDRKADAGKYVHAVAEALVLWATSPAGTGADIALPTLPEYLADVDYDDRPLSEVVEDMVDGFLAFVAVFAPEWLAAEMAVFHPGLGVAGTLDGIVALRGVRIGPAGRFVPAPGNVLRVCVDIKTGKHLDSTVDEQLAAYRRMTQALMPMGEIAAMPATDAAAVLHLRPEHELGHRLILISGRRDADAWNRFRRAAELYHGRAANGKKPGKVVHPLLADGTVGSPRLADLDGEGYGRAPAALARAGWHTLDGVAVMTADEVIAVAGVGPKTLADVRRMLGDHGLSLAGECLAADVVAGAAVVQ
jgi:hypothetical protein